MLFWQLLTAMVIKQGAFGYAHLDLKVASNSSVVGVKFTISP